MIGDMGEASHTVTARGRLATLGEAGVLDGSDGLVATRISRLVGEDATGDAALALAFAIRAVRDGSTALSLDGIADLEVDQDDAATGEALRAGSVVDLPDPAAWLETVRRSALVAEGVLHVDLGMVYLDRYHADERLVADALLARRGVVVTAVDPAAVEEVIADKTLDEAQQAAVRRVARQATTILTGGPGMGKTHTIASVLQALGAGSDRRLRVGLAAPTGKAAARMNEMLGDVRESAPSISQAVTLHRLLGSLPRNRSRFRHDAHNPLPHDVVVIDEASMVSLSMMARLIEALPRATRLLLVGDPDQLSSVEAGSVLADLVHGLESGDEVARLTQDHRLDHGRAALAQAFRAGDPDRVLAVVDGGADGVDFVETDEPTLDLVPHAVGHAEELRRLAVAGDIDGALAHLRRFRLLCAHRTGPFGTRRWNQLVEQSLAERAPEVSMQPMYVGRPILVNHNDYGLGLSNGDTGVVVHTGDGPRAVVESGSGTVQIAPWRLSDVETMHAMTVHKAQGSQAEHVTVVIPPRGSRLLTREMLYTAVTRAQEHVTLVASRAALRDAVQTPAGRSSGLAARLR